MPSYKLFKENGAWICQGALPSGRPFRFEAGKGSKVSAVEAVKKRLRHKMASASGSAKRWQKWKAAKNRPTTVKSFSAPPEPQVKASPPSPVARPSDDDLRSKLLGLGGAKPIEVDAVLPETPAGAAGAAADFGEEDDPELDGEGQELIASLLAKGATLGVVWLANRPLKKRKPPMQGEPHEKGLEWFHDGMEHNLKKILGKTATLGPTGKMLAGAAIICASVWMTAEPIPGGAAPPTHEAAPPAPPAAAATPTNGTSHPPVTSLARSASPLGVFGAPKESAN